MPADLSSPGPLLIPITGADSPSLSEVGGKAASLARLCQAGLPVPPATVLSAAFFAPWLVELAKNRPESADLDQVNGFALDSAQAAALAQLKHWMRDEGSDCYAVRSSALDEDGAEASFAGQYQTELGVKAEDVEAAIRRCFAASLAARITEYRRKSGLGSDHGHLAVIIQRQLASDIAGVGFSINPLNNDFDEALINASWGLGAAVVDGKVTPDHYLVSKPDRRLIERRLGDKQIRLALSDKGGVEEQPAPDASGWSLDDQQIDQLTAALVQIESLYQQPVDIEWAYVDGQLYLLQARPITTYLPLPPALLSPAGDQRRLYMDASLAKGMTSNQPYSPLGSDQVERAFCAMIETWMGPLPPMRSADQLVCFAGGRMYMNVSDLLWLVSSKRLAKSSEATDKLSAEILEHVDSQRYRTPLRPVWLNGSLFWRLPRALWRLRGLFFCLAQGLFAPRSLQHKYQRVVESLCADLTALRSDNRPLHSLQAAVSQRMIGEFPVLMGSMLFGMISPHLALGKLRPGEALALDQLSRGSQGNVIVEMNLALQRLAALLDSEHFKNLSALAGMLAQRQLPAPFLEQWDGFLARYGWRGADEMDVATPRYLDQPMIALKQMAALKSRTSSDLQSALAEHGAARQQAQAQLEAGRGRIRRFLLRKILQWNALFSGARDTPKHVNVLANYVIRARALRIGAECTARGRLDSAEQVFDLNFDDVQQAAVDPTLDLHARREQRLSFLRRLRARARQFPPVIDSRGRILRAPPKPSTPGVLAAMPVSAGIARGPVKRMRHASDGEIQPGDILLAYTTDPGWTPLFVNAGAIVLEVGGVLQHGAVIAREFGKPCVVGIADLLGQFADGEWVEVDGAMGTVTRLTENDRSPTPPAA